MTNAERIKEIEDRAARSTPGEWEAWNGCSWWRIGISGHSGRQYEIISPTTDSSDGHPNLTGPNLRDDLQFVAHAHQDIPWLLSTLRAVEADNARLRGALEVCVEVLCESANLNNYRNLSDEELGRAWMTAHTLGTAALQDPRP